MSDRTQLNAKLKVAEDGIQPEKKASSFAEKKMSQMRETLKKHPIPFDTIRQ